jgi:hemoglobin
MAPPEEETAKDGPGGGGLVVMASSTSSVMLLPRSSSRELDEQEEDLTVVVVDDDDDDDNCARSQARKHPPASSLFERLGGTPAVRAVVEDFYGRCVADPDLERFFDRSKLSALKYHQLEFLKVAFATNLSPDLDVPAMILDKHRSLFAIGLDVSHFDRVCEHLVASLVSAGAAPGLVTEAAQVLLPLRPVFELGQERYGSSQQGGTSNVNVEGSKSNTTPVYYESHTVLHSNTAAATVATSAAGNSNTEKRKETLSDRLGGVDALKAAVSGLYNKILDDSDLSPFFEEVNVTALKLHQIEFLKVAFGQIPDELDVADLMMQKHARLFVMGLNETHFDKVAQHLVATLLDLGVDASLVDEAVAIVGPLRAVFEHGALQASKRKTSDAP